MVTYTVGLLQYNKLIGRVNTLANNLVSVYTILYRHMRGWCKCNFVFDSNDNQS